MNKSFSLMAFTGILFACVFQVGAVQAFDVNAGPIWDNSDANVKCPGTCQWYGGWNGN